MVFTCEDCGKRYTINPEKIPGEGARFKCYRCGNVITVKRSQPAADMFPDEFVTEVDTSTRGVTNGTDGIETKALSQRRGIVFGLRKKMVLFFVLVPVLLMLGASILYISQMGALANLIRDDSSEIVTQMAEQIILEKGRAVARETKLFLDTHPTLKKGDFNNHPEFKKIAMQKVGKTGYTLLVERKTRDRPVEFMWVHPVAKLVGIDLEDAMKKRLGDKWARWDKVRAKDHITKGYYTWFDNREKYCAGIPISGTPFNIVSSTYIDEFYKPVEALQKRADNITQVTYRTVIILLIIAALFIGAISFFYANRLSRNIQQLTDITDQISVGDLSAEVNLRSNDELGVLADAITRLQVSIRLAMDRIKRKG